MGRTPTIVLYITVAVLLLFLISRTPKSNPNHRSRRLKLRSTFSFNPADTKHHDPIPFDPIIVDIENRREDREWAKHYKDIVDAPAAEAQPEWEDFMNAEDYLNDEDRFNVTNRLLVLFPKIDTDPVDGFVTVHELTEWHLRLQEDKVMHRTEKDMQVHDKNHDGFVSFAEYEPPSWTRNSDSFEYDMGWWKEEHFNASDVDGDGLLNKTEFNDFYHPADSNNPKLLEWLCKEEVRERDTDRDGKLNFKEFFHGVFDLVRNYDEEEEGRNSSQDSGNAMEGSAKALFARIDKDGDGYLSDKELLQIIGKLHPSERYYAKQQAEYIISQADTDKDGRLSLGEMIESPYVFYSAIFDEQEEYEYHDEF